MPKCTLTGILSGYVLDIAFLISSVVILSVEGVIPDNNFVFGILYNVTQSFWQALRFELSHVEMIAITFFLSIFCVSFSFKWTVEEKLGLNDW